MIGESICLGRNGIHSDLFIKVGRLIVTLSPASRVPSALQSPQSQRQYHTRLTL